MLRYFIGAICYMIYSIIGPINVCTNFEIYRYKIDEEISSTSGSKVMVQIIIFLFSVTLTLIFDLCSIFLSHALD